MLRMSNVKKNYVDFKLDCSLELKEGAITGLIGVNGAGKSTTFKAILGLIKIEDGEINIMGTDIGDLDPKLKSEIGVVMTDSTFSSFFSIKEIVRIMSASYDKFNKEKFISKCNEYNLPLDKATQDFSTGMKAKLKLLLALSYEARLLILDEPTLGLDPMTRMEMLDEIRKYMEVPGRSVLISSHITKDLEGLCDDIYIISKGKIVLHEDTDTIVGKYALIRLTQEQYDNIEKQHIICEVKERTGYKLLTDCRSFYEDNYKNLVIERGNIDDVLIMLESSAYASGKE